MSVDMVRGLLGWCTIINYAILFVWFVVFAMAHGWLHRLHSRWFSISREQFDAIHYSLMGIYKLGILLLNLTPYVALRFLA